MSDSSLRRGDMVEVRGPAEILATLDESGGVSNLPFMPEMAAYCGRRFTVESRAEKICDTIKYTGSRRLQDAVILGDLRCDGAAHGGCQAECRMFWKEAWLRRVSPDAPAPAPVDAAALQALLDAVARHVKRPGPDGADLWACQSCELMRATERLGTFDPRPYVKEYACGNVTASRFLKTTARAVVEESLRKVGMFPDPYMSGPGSKGGPEEAPLNLQPGELVQVKSKDEIAATLNDKGYNRGLWFDREMAAYCGGKYRVRRRITRFIDDRFAKMVELKSDCVTLDDVVCTGLLSARRWFCPRAAFPYWRESWLRRA
jgi:hypothetical protein